MKKNKETMEKLKQNALNIKCDEFVKDLDIVQKKHNIIGTVCHNWDNEQMGYVQLHKVIESEKGGFIFVTAFSSKGDELCPHCKTGEADQ